MQLASEFLQHEASMLFDPLLAHATAHCSPFCFTSSDLRGNLIGQFEANVFGQLQSLEVL